MNRCPLIYAFDGSLVHVHALFSFLQHVAFANDMCSSTEGQPTTYIVSSIRSSFVFGPEVWRCCLGHRIFGIAATAGSPSDPGLDDDY